MPGMVLGHEAMEGLCGQWVKRQVLTKRGTNKQLLGRHVSIDEVSAQNQPLVIGSLCTIQRQLLAITMTMITTFNCDGLVKIRMLTNFSAKEVQANCLVVLSSAG